MHLRREGMLKGAVFSFSLGLGAALIVFGAAGTCRGKEDQMTKVYIVTTGEYSDYGISAAFGSLEKARLYCERMGALGYPGDIVEMPLDPEEATPPEGWSWWDVVLTADGQPGREPRATMEPPSFWIEPPTDYRQGDYRGYEAKDYAGTLRYCFPCISAKDARHALKIASERRARMIAEGE
jgi:hypothetical protein